ncbi:cation:proton antiporter domain-containing protein [Oceanicaulis alexandrii]|uniref:cation:proton antiporter domain-containing protein n=1 Tax=Oceanicaulis alexandrii TaxID=153233 RepID=UPI0003B38842|nr:cation:proton antiporter [Oceanicaulis alexandrii]
MEHGHGYEIWLKDAVVFLIAAGVVVPLFRLFKLSSVLGFLIAGLALGPFALGGLAERFAVLEWVTISEPEAAKPFAELGVLFLLFLLGLELSFQRLWQLRRAVFGAGGLQAFGSAAVLGVACFVIGQTAPTALVIGLALALSSTAIVMQIMAEERRTAAPVGRASLSVLLMQDILVAPILILVGFLTRDSGADIGAALLSALFQGVLALAWILLLGRLVLRPVFRLVAKAGGRDLLMALTLAVVVGASMLTAGAGLSLALGAFLAGLMLGETEFKHQAEIDLEPFKGLLLGVFFMTVGMGLDLGAVWQNVGLVLAGLVGMLIVKGLLVYLACRLFAGDHRLSLEAAFLLAPAGEFAFVILATANAGDVIPAETATMVAAIAGLSMLLTPALAAIGRKLATRSEESVGQTELPSDLVDLEGHVIIAGFGRVGRTMARVLETENVTMIALDMNAEKVAKGREEGWPVFYGDAGRAEFLERAGAARADMFVVTVDDAQKASDMVRAARNLRPDALIIARGRDRRHAVELAAAGASHVTLETAEAALQLAGRALEDLGLSADIVRDRLAAEREDVYASDAV